MRPYLLALIGAAVAAVRGSVQQPTPQQNKPCREHPQLVASCFTIHGAMRYWNGAPSVRIWRIGTTRVLGISEGRFALAGYCNLPHWMEDTLDAGKEIIADFKVCPFTR